MLIFGSCCDTLPLVDGEGFSHCKFFMCNTQLHALARATGMLPEQQWGNFKSALCSVRLMLGPCGYF